jgi:hypothetical protein
LVGFDIIPGAIWSLENFNGWPAFEPNKGYTYDMRHRFWKQGLPANFENLVQLAPCPNLPDIDTLGLERAGCANWGGTHPDIPVKEWLDWTVDNENYKANFNKIKEMARLLARKEIHFVLYTTPESPWYRTTGSYGLIGPGRETGKAIVAQLKALEDSFPPYVHFYDANLDGYHDYADSEAFNVDHLCSKGARKFSGRMDSLVHSILDDKH